MSYDISLNDPVTGEVLQIDPHIMTGAIYPAEYVNGQWVPMPCSDAELTVTYNYSKYYYEAVEDGIRAINGMSGADSIQLLSEIKNHILTSYKDDDGWITTTRQTTYYIIKETGFAMNPNQYMEWRHFGGGKSLAQEEIDEVIQSQQGEYKQYEGDISDYWEVTAANALRPIEQLIALAKLRPDGVWEVS